MDTNTVLAILGIAATVLLGVGAIFLTLRHSRRVGIAHVEETCIALIDDITQGIGDLEIRFRNAVVAENVVLLKGFIVNTGKRDISPDMVERPLRLVLPKGFQWLDCQITDRVRDLDVDVVNTSTDGIEFKFGLLKTDEYFRFDALATVPSEESDEDRSASVAPNTKLRNGLSFDFRIADAYEIQKLRLRDLRTRSVFPQRLEVTEPRLSRALGFLFGNHSSLVFGVLLILTGVTLYFLFSYIEPNRIAYEIAGQEEDKPVVVFQRAKSEGIELRNDAGFSKTLSVEEFDRLPKKTKLEPPSRRIQFFILLLYVGMGVLGLIGWAIRYFRSRKYREILLLAES